MANNAGTAKAATKAATKAPGKKLSTGGGPTAALADEGIDARGRAAIESSAAASGLAEMRKRATRIAKPVEGAFVPVTPISYLPDGAKAGCRADCQKEHEHVEPGRKTEHPTVIDAATGVERPNVITDLSQADIDSFLALGAIRPHTE